MALTTCAECSAEISDKALTCPKCGAPQSVESAPVVEKSGSIWGKVLLGAGGLFLLVILIGANESSKPANAEKYAAKDAIDRCWEQQSRKSLSADSQQFIAGACEKLESDFLRQYGYRP